MPHDHPYFIKNFDNSINHPTGFCVWNGWGSVAHHNGPMFHYIMLTLATHPNRNIMVSSCSDDMFPIPDELIEYAKQNDAVVVAPVLCSFGHIKPRECLHIPASDEYFVNSIYDIFQPYRVPWEDKINAAVWRGGLSGEMLRIDTVKACLKIPNTDVKLIDNWPRPEYNPEKTPELFAERIEAYDQCKYKAIFWIDGNCISSNVLWIFGSGSVPIIINETEFWFKDKLIPWVHFVPVKPDLSDLEEKVKWIFEHDDEASTIAEKALEFCHNELSPEAQRRYLDKAIDEHIKENKKPAPEQTPATRKLFPLLTFGGHGPDRYVRRRGFLILEKLAQYYDNHDPATLQALLSIANELMNITEFPEVRKITIEALQLLEQEIPATIEYTKQYTHSQ